MQEEISFGVWLRKQRSALDLTQQALADQVGCAEVTVRRIEAGTLKPSKELAGILLEKLGISYVLAAIRVDGQVKRQVSGDFECGHANIDIWRK